MCESEWLLTHSDPKFEVPGEERSIGVKSQEIEL